MTMAKHSSYLIIYCEDTFVEVTLKEDLNEG